MDENIGLDQRFLQMWTTGGAKIEMDRGRCTEGGALREVHKGRWIRGSAPRVAMSWNILKKIDILDSSIERAS